MARRPQIANPLDRDFLCLSLEGSGSISLNGHQWHLFRTWPKATDVYVNISISYTKHWLGPGAAGWRSNGLKTERWYSPNFSSFSHGEVTDPLLSSGTAPEGCELTLSKYSLQGQNLILNQQYYKPIRQLFKMQSAFMVISKYLKTVEFNAA